MKLTKEIINQTKKYTTPFLLIDLQKLRQNYRNIKKNFPGVEVFYAMKANDHLKILEVLAEEGASFEISSLTELKALLALNISPKKIMCFNSVKNPVFLQEMSKRNITVMAYDSKDEIDKIAKYAPNAQIVLRIIVNNLGSEWPLTKKFGIDAIDALPLLKYAKQKKLKPVGLTFHVGSQCLNKNNWASALYVCDDIWNQAKKGGIELEHISLGGGLPVKHLKKTPSFKEIGDTIQKSLKKNFKTTNGKLRVTIEPGRGLVGDAGVMVTSVVGKAIRGTEDWIWIDVGVFNGLMETIQSFVYEIKSETNGRKKRYTVAGPSCDSVDIPFKDILLPQVKVGDRLYLLNTGAYTTVYAAPFNGFAIPGVHFINE